MLDRLMEVFPRAREMTTAMVAQRLRDWSGQQVANALNRAVAAGLLKRVRPGLFRKAKA